MAAMATIGWESDQDEYMNHCITDLQLFGGLRARGRCGGRCWCSSLLKCAITCYHCRWAGGKVREPQTEVATAAALSVCPCLVPQWSRHSLKDSQVLSILHWWSPFCCLLQWEERVSSVVMACTVGYHRYNLNKHKCVNVVVYSTGILSCTS